MVTDHHSCTSVYTRTAPFHEYTCCVEYDVIHYGESRNIVHRTYRYDRRHDCAKCSMPISNHGTIPIISSKTCAKSSDARSQCGSLYSKRSEAPIRHLQSRLRALRLTRRRCSRSHELVLRPLLHELCALLLHNHLLLAVCQRPRHAEQ
jgi:hypothetical protein